MMASLFEGRGIRRIAVTLLIVLRRRMDYPELKRYVREQAAAFKATVVLIEDKASGTELIQELIAEALHPIKRYAPEGDKVMRLHAQSATIENAPACASPSDRISVV
jgi:phage terminase large subunit-like protein